MRALFKAGGSLRFTREAHRLRKDGREFVGEMSWDLVETAEGPLMLAVGRDISERLATDGRPRLDPVFELTADGRELRPLAAWGDADETPDAIQIGPGSNAGAALESRDAISLADGPRRRGFQSGLAVAVRTGEETFGVLCASRRQFHARVWISGSVVSISGSVVSKTGDRRSPHAVVGRKSIDRPGFEGDRWGSRGVLRLG